MVPVSDLKYCILFYCLNNGLTVEQTINKYTVVKNAQIEFVKWDLSIPQPDLYYLLENTTPEQVVFAKGKEKDYNIEQKMKADPLYPLVKNLIIPLSPGQYVERISALEQQIAEMKTRLERLEQRLT